MMAGEPDHLVLRLLRDIREEVGGIRYEQTETKHRIEKLDRKLDDGVAIVEDRITALENRMRERER